MDVLSLDVSALLKRPYQLNFLIKVSIVGTNYFNIRTAALMVIMRMRYYYYFISGDAEDAKDNLDQGINFFRPEVE